jgi:hypothetical protein
MQMIGGKEVILSQTLLIPDGEEATVETVVEGWTVKIIVHFIPNGSEKPTVEWITEDDFLRMTFKGWRSTLGGGSQKPLKLGETETKRPLEFMVYHMRSGKLNRLDLQLLLGGPHE